MIKKSPLIIDLHKQKNISGTVFPATADTYDLGTSALSWNKLYINDFFW